VDSHWKGREGLKVDMTDEALWPTISDIVEQPGRLLEAGCGTGQWVQFFVRQGHDAVGIDYAESGLNVGRKYNSSLELIQADFRKLPFADESFDYITSFGAVEHDVDGPEDALKEFYRVLKPTGQLMCSVPCLNACRTITLPWLMIKRWLKCRKMLRKICGKTLPYEFYEYMWSPREYARILRRCGFQLRDMRGYGTSGASQLSRLFRHVFGRKCRFYSDHMMMAVCRKA